MGQLKRSVRRYLTVRAGLPLCVALLLAACSEPRPVHTRAVVIGIDGADWRIIEPLIEEGSMPHLAALKQRGAWGSISTLTDIALSPAIWTSVATGRSPVDHGITWFMAGTGEEKTPVRSHDRRVPAIWNLLADQGLPATVIGWWATYPAEEIGPGAVVSDALGVHGFGVTAHDPDPAATTYPPSLSQEMAALMPPPQQISSAFLNRFVDLDEAELAQKLFHPGRQARVDSSQPIQLFQDYAATAQGYTAIGESLLSRRRDVLTMLYFEQVDSLSHLFMRFAPPSLPDMPAAEQAAYSRVVSEWYRYQDELLGRLMAHVDLESTAVFVLSDHGFKSGERRVRRTSTIDPRAAHLDHEKEGIFVAAGPQIRRGEKISGLSVLDMTPTLLHYLGLPVAKDMDGRVAQEIFEPEAAAARPIVWIETYGSSERGEQERAEMGASDRPAAVDDEAIRRLRALGYAGGSGRPSDQAEPEPDSEAETPQASPEMLNSLGDLQLAEQNLEEAEANFQRALELDPQSAGAMLGLASVARARGDLNEAQRLAKKTIRLAPDNPAAISSLAELRRDQGRLDEAVQLYRQALGIDDAQPSLFLGLSDALHRLGRNAQARKAAEQALELSPDSFVGHYNLGVIHLAEERLDEAQRAFETALTAEPAHPNVSYALNNLGSILLDQGKNDEALSVFRQATEVAPEQFSAHYNLGSILLGRGLNREAAKALEAAADLEPDHSQTLVHLGLAYLRTANLAEANRAFAACRLLEPGNWQALLGLAAIAAQEKQSQRAEQLLAEAIRLGGPEAREAAGTFPALLDMQGAAPPAP